MPASGSTPPGAQPSNLRQPIREVIYLGLLVAFLLLIFFGGGYTTTDHSTTHALSDCSNLVQAIQAYYDDTPANKKPDGFPSGFVLNLEFSRAP